MIRLQAWRVAIPNIPLDPCGAHGEPALGKCLGPGAIPGLATVPHLGRSFGSLGYWEEGESLPAAPGMHHGPFPPPRSFWERPGAGGGHGDGSQPLSRKRE